MDARRRPQPITIGVAGTHSTGKTTFLHRVQSELERSGRRVATVGQIAARARVVGFPILDQHTADSTLWVITRGISEELEAGLAADVVLVDRPAPDALGYYRAALEHRGEPPQHERLEYLTDLVCHHTATYSLLLATRLDPAIALGSNKARNGDPQFRALADLHIHAILDQVGVSYRPLPAHEHHAGVAAVLEACGIAPAAGKGSTVGLMARSDQSRLGA